MTKASASLLSIVLTIVAVLVVEFGILLVVMYGGVYDVAADRPEGALTTWVFSSALDSSVESRAAGVKVPADFKPAATVEGMRHYLGMCEACHGGVGVEKGEIGKGLSPEPPDLKESAREFEAAQLHWVIDHGIRMTGMPSFGKTHSQEAMWTISAFVKGMATMTSEEYHGLAAQATSGPSTMQR